MWVVMRREIENKNFNMNSLTTLTKEDFLTRLKTLMKVISLLVSVNVSYAVNLGVAGHAFPIVEIDILSILQKRLNKFTQADIDKLNQDMTREVRERLNRPRFITLPRAVEYRSFTYDPRIKVTKDLKLDNKELEQYSVNVRLHIMNILKRHFSSNFISPTIKKAIWIEKIVFVKKGTVVNPLKYIWHLEPLLFIDSDDIDQIMWAIKQKGKIILVKGEPIKLAKKLKREVYFDQVTQKGRLVERFGIKRLPARVRLPYSKQRKLLKGLLLVEEVVI